MRSALALIGPELLYPKEVLHIYLENIAMSKLTKSCWTLILIFPFQAGCVGAAHLVSMENQLEFNKISLDFLAKIKY